MNKEVWKEIPGYTDYEVSNHGRLMSKKRGFPKILNGAIYTTEGGSVFRKYTLSRGMPAKPETIFGHTLVFWVFAGYRPKRWEKISHKNRDTMDNRFENLELRTNSVVQGEVNSILQACKNRGVKLADFLHAISQDADELIDAFLLKQKIHE